MASSRKAARYPVLEQALAPWPVPGQWASRRLRFVGTAFSAVLILAALWVAIAVPLAQDRVLPGVHAGDVPIGGKTRIEARETVAARVVGFSDRPVELTVDGRTFTPLPAELGFTVDVDAAIDTAMDHGRDREVVDGVLRAARFSREPVVVPLSVRFDRSRFDAYLDEIELGLGDAPVDAQLILDGDGIRIVPGSAGRAIDRDALESTLAVRLLAFEPASANIARSERAPSISTSEAARTRDMVEDVVADPFVLSLGEESWTLEPDQMLAMLEVAPDPERPGALLVRPNQATVAAAVEELAGEIDAEPRDSFVQDLGTHSWLVPERAGRTVDRDALAASLGDGFASGNRAVEVPVVELVQPDISIEEMMLELDITEVVATGDSVYEGSGGGRAHNIEHAAYMVDGTLVPPGGVFSFNDAVGSLFNGEFVDAGSYIDGPNGQSLAGGICQVSTTVYRAALLAGFPIVEWWPHSYRSPFYERGGWEPGYDASVVQYRRDPEASSDFRFENPTDSWLLIRATVSDQGELEVEILGAPTGYEVEFDEPEIEVIEEATDEVTIAVEEDLPAGTILPDQPAMDGLRVTVVRYVYDEDENEVAVDTFVSTYGSYGPIRRVSPDMEQAAYGMDD